MHDTIKCAMVIKYHKGRKREVFSLQGERNYVKKEEKKET